MNSLLLSSPSPLFQCPTHTFKCSPQISLKPLTSSRSWRALALLQCPTLATKSPPKTHRARGVGLQTRAQAAGVVPAKERVISTVSYMLPLLNSLQYGRFLIAKVPALEFILQPLLPVIGVYKTVPFATFAAFFGLYLAVVRNPSFSHFVRLNAMQALVLDVLLILPTIFTRVLSPQSKIGVSIMIAAYNVIFLVLLGGFGYAFANSILGKTPKIPYVTEAAEVQLG